MWLLRVAALTQRVLLVQQTHPAPMEAFFLPSFIDWSIGAMDLPPPETLFVEWSL
jgi:hypothetical protein